MSTGRLFAFLSASVVLSGCASVPAMDRPGWMSLLREALTVSRSELEDRAGKGDARAQFSAGLIYQYGLQGGAKDPAKAMEYKRSARASRGYTPITQYIAGINGNPSRTAIINVPRYGIDALEARYAETCAQAVAEDVTEANGAKACGSAEIFIEMKSLWSGRS